MNNKIDPEQKIIINNNVENNLHVALKTNSIMASFS